MKSIGLDVHKRVIQAAIVDGDTGEVREGFRFECTGAAIRAFCREHVGREDRVALESTTNCWAVAPIVREFSDFVTVSNPMRTKLIAQSNKKCDKVDALVLAQLLLAGFLPAVWEPDAATREKRELTSRRAALVQDRTCVKNRLHSVLAQRLITFEGKLFSTAGLAFLRSVPLDRAARFLVDTDLAQLEAIERGIKEFDAVLVRLAATDESAKLLVTLPGFDFAGALGIVAAAGDITRFPDADHFAAYLGLVPSTRQSADTTYHGPITKQGRSHARWIFCQAAQHLDANPGPLGHFFRRLSHKKGRNKAVVAAAHKLAIIAWHLLTKREPYRYADPSAVSAKLGRIQVKAGNAKRRGGTPKGQPRPATYGSGVRTRGIKSLDEVLAEQGLPPRSVPPPGEAKFLERNGLSDAVQTLTAARRRTRNEGKSAGSTHPSGRGRLGDGS